MTIIYSAPIFTMIFSFVFLRIKQGLFKIFFALILIVGVLLVIRPPFLFPHLKPNVEPHPISNQTVTNTNQTSPAEDPSETKDNIYWIGVAICVVTAACTGLISVVFNYLQVIFLLYLILRILFVRKNVIDLPNQHKYYYVVCTITSTENWVSKQSFFVLILITA